MESLSSLAECPYKREARGGRGKGGLSKKRKNVLGRKCRKAGWPEKKIGG